jgi:hypothetical protein
MDRKIYLEMSATVNLQRRKVGQIISKSSVVFYMIIRWSEQICVFYFYQIEKYFILKMTYINLLLFIVYLQSDLTTVKSQFYKLLWTDKLYL